MYSVLCFGVSVSTIRTNCEWQDRWPVNIVDQLNVSIFVVVAVVVIIIFVHCSFPSRCPKRKMFSFRPMCINNQNIENMCAYGIIDGPLKTQFTKCYLFSSSSSFRSQSIAKLLSIRFFFFCLFGQPKYMYRNFTIFALPSYTPDSIESKIERMFHLNLLSKCESVQAWAWYMHVYCVQTANESAISIRCNAEAILYTMHTFKWEYLQFRSCVCTVHGMGLKNEVNSSYCAIFGDKFALESRITFSSVWFGTVTYVHFIPMIFRRFGSAVQLST